MGDGIPYQSHASGRGGEISARDGNRIKNEERSSADTGRRLRTAPDVPSTLAGVEEPVRRPEARCAGRGRTRIDRHGGIYRNGAGPERAVLPIGAQGRFDAAALPPFIRRAEPGRAVRGAIAARRIPGADDILPLGGGAGAV